MTICLTIPHGKALWLAESFLLQGWSAEEAECGEHSEDCSVAHGWVWYLETMAGIGLPRSGD